jgi:hypothetical protein
MAARVAEERACGFPGGGVRRMAVRRAVFRVPRVVVGSGVAVDQVVIGWCRPDGRTLHPRDAFRYWTNEDLDNLHSARPEGILCHWGRPAEHSVTPPTSGSRLNTTANTPLPSRSPLDTGEREFHRKHSAPRLEFARHRRG